MPNNSKAILHFEHQKLKNPNADTKYVILYTRNNSQHFPGLPISQTLTMPLVGAEEVWYSHTLCDSDTMTRLIRFNPFSACSGSQLYNNISTYWNQSERAEMCVQCIFSQRNFLIFKMQAKWSHIKFDHIVYLLLSMSICARFFRLESDEGPTKRKYSRET